MADFVTPAIPAGQLVTVTSNVLPAGGNGLDEITTCLTESFRVPIGSVYQFGSPTAVTAFFGQGSQESALASVYFNGFDNSNIKPGQMNFWQYALAATNAHLFGGNISGLSLTQLQSYAGTLNVTIDSVLATASINLAAATSFSNAAQIIQNDLAITGLANAAFTAAMGATFTGTATGTSLVVTSVTGYISIGDTITGTGISGTVTIVSQSSGTTGGAGTYITSAATTASTAAITASSNNIIVSVVASGALAVGQLLAGNSVAAHTYLNSTAGGGAGTYTTTGAQQHLVSGAMTTTNPAVSYDSVSGAFIVHSGTTGPTSTVTFGSGALATSLLLTQATGAVLSQGSAAMTESGAMNAITAITQNWVTFFTTWEPTDQSKENFASWASGQNGGTPTRYGYIMWETNVLDVEQGGPSAPATFINAGNLSGTVMVYQNPAITTLSGEKAALFAGMVASVDFTEQNGAVAYAGKGQAGLLPDITNGTSSILLAGNPQVNGSYGYGINFFGNYTTANQAFIQWQRGLISGPFTWADDYFEQIWLNNQCQLALMQMLQVYKSIPYDQAGYAIVEATLLGAPVTPGGPPAGPINQALYFGMIVVGVALSATQASEINTAAGNPNAALAVQNQGFYLQVGPASAQTRAGRTSPPCTLWYATGESIQSLNLVSVQAQ